MCYQLRSTTIPQAKHHKFERLLMLIGLINKSLAIYGVLGKARPEHGRVISGVNECDRAGKQHGQKPCENYSISDL